MQKKKYNHPGIHCLSCLNCLNIQKVNNVEKQSTVRKTSFTEHPLHKGIKSNLNMVNMTYVMNSGKICSDSLTLLKILFKKTKSLSENISPVQFKQTVLRQYILP